MKSLGTNKSVGTDSLENAFQSLKSHSTLFSENELGFLIPSFYYLEYDQNIIDFSECESDTRLNAYVFNKMYNHIYNKNTVVYSLQSLTIFENNIDQLIRSGCLSNAEISIFFENKFKTMLESSNNQPKLNSLSS